MGFTTYLVREAEALAGESPAVSMAAGTGENPAVEPADLGGNCRLASPAANTLENEYLSVTVEPNGSLTVLDKQKGHATGTCCSWRMGATTETATTIPPQQTTGC